MKVLKTLVLMQLKEKFNLKGRNFKGKKTFFGIVFGILKFALVVALCYLMLFLCQRLKLFSLTIILPSSVLAVVFTVMLIISIVSATMGLTKSMYYSYDNPVLLTLPCKPTQVYLSKLVVFYIYELIRNMSFMVPLFIAFGIINGLPIIFYFWLFVCFIFVSMIPVVVGSLLSIPTMWFYNFFRQYKRLQFASILVIIGLIVFLVVKGISIIPENIDLIGTWGTTYWVLQDYLDIFKIKFAPFYNLTNMIVGIRATNALKVVIFSSKNILIFVELIASIVAIFILGLVTTKPLFYKMASKPFEYRKNNDIKAKKNKVSSKSFSSFKTQVLLSVRDGEKMLSNIILTIALPILIFFLNKLFAAMNTGTLGNNLTVSFNILLILLITLTSNYYAASVFSRDGRSSYLIKVQPSRYQPLLISKLFVNTIFMTISYIATLFVLIYSSGVSVSQAIYIIICCYTLYIAHLAYSAELDIMNPQIELYATIGNSENNPNETKSTLTAMFGSFVMAFATFIFLGESGFDSPYIKIMWIGIVMMILRIYMLLNKIKLYYKEK